MPVLRAKSRTRERPAFDDRVFSFTALRFHPAAARDLGAHALMLYLYFAANADGFKLALSPAAIRQAVGMPQSTYRDQFVKLIDKGYLVQRKDSNTYDFYETPQRDTQSEMDDTADDHTPAAVIQGKVPVVPKEAAESREINIKRSISVALGMALLLSLVACSEKTIGTISGAENEYITIDDVKYVLDIDHGFSQADKGTYLGKVTNAKITMKVYSVKGDANEDHIYALWDQDGAFYKRER